MTIRILVAGVGNIFLGDDGFGSEVARRLAGQHLPEEVRVTDYGIRGMHLAYDLLDGYDALVLVDAMPGRGRPGDITVLEVGPDDVGRESWTPMGWIPSPSSPALAHLGESFRVPWWSAANHSMSARVSV
ncbi:MAG: hydrogenase maturation protease [Nocardioidaceae bacterium]